MISFKYFSLISFLKLRISLKHLNAPRRLNFKNLYHSVLSNFLGGSGNDDDDSRDTLYLVNLTNYVKLINVYFIIYRYLSCISRSFARSFTIYS